MCVSLPMAFLCTMPKSMAKLRPTAQVVNVSSYLKEQLLAVNARPRDLLDYCVDYKQLRILIALDNVWTFIENQYRSDPETMFANDPRPKYQLIRFLLTTGGRPSDMLDGLNRTVIDLLIDLEKRWDLFEKAQCNFINQMNREQVLWQLAQRYVLV